MECAIGMAGRAIALPEFNLVGQTIHYALPDLLIKIGNLFLYVHQCI